MKIGFAGRFEFVASGGARGEVKLAEMNNNITNAGLDRIGVGSIADWCRVGSGNRPANDGDTALVTQTAETNSTLTWTTFYEPGPPPRSAVRRTYRFAKGVAAGTHSEVGIGWKETIAGQTVNGLWSRALIKDENGDPLSITVLSDEVLDVIYTLYMYLDLTDDVKQFVYKGVNRMATTRFSDVRNHTYMYSIMTRGLPAGTSSGWSHCWFGGATSVLGDVYTPPTMRPGGNNTTVYGKTMAIYVNGSRERECTWTIPDTSYTSDNKIGVIVVTPHHSEGSWGGTLDVKTQFEPPLEKDYTEEFTYTGKISWGRYTPPAGP